MRRLFPDVYLFEGLGGVNAYLLVTGRELTLVDSGMPGHMPAMASQIEGLGFTLTDLRAIVLTHGHTDHTGSADELARASGATVMAHRLEVPYVERKAPMPRALGVRGLLSSLSERLMFRGAPPHVGRALEDGDNVDAIGGLAVILTPGHTPGSICLYHAGRRLLFCGDTMFATNPLTRRGGLQPSLPMVTWNQSALIESLTKLASLSVDGLCPGHGDPITEGAGERIRELVTSMSRQSGHTHNEES